MSKPKSAPTGINRTGLQMSPANSKRLLEIADTPVAFDSQVLATVRQEYIEEADPVGSIPLPGTVRGVASAGAKLLTGKHPQAFLDKLGERLAFERGGTRIYDALITKFNATPDLDGGVTVEALMEIRDEEASHFHLVSEVIREMGGDPTSQTPSADLVGVESMGVMQAVSDPRTSFADSLHAVLIAELTDVAGWELLARMADRIGEHERVRAFNVALEDETRHLAMVRGWYEALTLQRLA
jgi:rubrerythrin